VPPDYWTCHKNVNNPDGVRNKMRIIPGVINAKAVLD
jgi:hypothetical protein